MTVDERLQSAAMNNAVWCDTVCRAHGLAGEFRDGLWVNKGAVPRFYPNAITLDGPSHAGDHRQCLEALIRDGMPPIWSVKDSFRTLDLEPFGLRILFDAHWLYAETVPTCEPSSDDVIWDVVNTPQELAEWHAAWGRDDAWTGIFLPALLTDQNIAIIAARRDGRIVAGGIANLAAGVVGISNIFVSGEDRKLLKCGVIAEASRHFPGYPLVGYERGDELGEMVSLGFETVGALRVWLRDG